jgi:Domain of unknown function (DUF5664)
MDDQTTKPTNPKDALAIGRLPLHLVPDTLKVMAAPGFMEGALKYGAFNWRISGVSASVYISAFERHWIDWKNGEDHDPKTGVHNLSSCIACLGIIMDAALCGQLTDDRPPRAPLSKAIDDLEPLMRSLRAQFGDRNPRHMTIADALPSAAAQEPTAHG